MDRERERQRDRERERERKREENREIERKKESEGDIIMYIWYYISSNANLANTITLFTNRYIDR